MPALNISPVPRVLWWFPAEYAEGTAFAIPSIIFSVSLLGRRSAQMATGERKP